MTPMAYSKQGIHRVFDTIAPRYDLINTLSSFGLDAYWRNEAARLLKPVRHQRILDLACGTGELGLTFLRKIPDIESIIGLDLSEGMIALAKAKTAQTPAAGRMSFEVGNAEALAHPDNTFDLVSIAFGIRNIPDFELALRDMHRVLRPGGHVLICEFSIPENRLSRQLFLGYLRLGIPLIGRLFSRDPDAYVYLNQTIEAFPSGHAFARHLAGAGFRNITLHPMTLGAVTLYMAEK